MPDFARARARMVAQQIAGRGVRDPALLAAMGEVPREAFVAPDCARCAYDDGPLPIGEGQTISQPFVVALMLEAAALQPGDRLLEVGAGSGYAAAVASLIAGRVVAIERHPGLATAARDRLARLGYGNVTVQAGDGTLGCPEEAPFDAILVSAGGPDVPAALKAQLAVGGRLVIPVGSERGKQHLRKLTRLADRASWRDEDLGRVAFVSLVGAQGWPEPDRAIPRG